MALQIFPVNFQLFSKPQMLYEKFLLHKIHIGVYTNIASYINCEYFDDKDLSIIEKYSKYLIKYEILIIKGFNKQRAHKIIQLIA